MITGIRRCGKSTLLRQLSARYDDFLYINFDDDRLMDFPCRTSLPSCSFSRRPPRAQKPSSSTRSRMSPAGSGSSAASTTRDTRFFSPAPMQTSSQQNSGPSSRELQKITLYPFSFREVLQFGSIPTGRITGEEKSRDPRCVRPVSYRWRVPRLPEVRRPRVPQADLG